MVEQGLINPIKRELRYLIESAVKYLYADQQNPGKTLAEKTTFLRSIDSSLDVCRDLSLGAFHTDDQKQFTDELYDTYRKMCAFVHLSPSQVGERLKQHERGGAMGYESTKELRDLGRLLFRVYDMVFAIYFHGLSLDLTGDAFIGAFDDLPRWCFHKGKYVKVMSKYFDYKNERNIKKYGESRPWDFSNWPAPQL